MTNWKSNRPAFSTPNSAIHIISNIVIICTNCFVKTMWTVLRLSEMKRFFKFEWNFCRAYWGFADHFKEQADVLLSSLDHSYKRLLQGELSNSSSSNSLNTAGGLRPATAAAAAHHQRSRQSSVTGSNENLIDGVRWLIYEWPKLDTCGYLEFFYIEKCHFLYLSDMWDYLAGGRFF